MKDKIGTLTRTDAGAALVPDGGGQGYLRGLRMGATAFWTGIDGGRRTYVLGPCGESEGEGIGSMGAL